MKILALIFFSTTVIRGIVFFAKEETFKSFNKFVASVIYLVTAIMSYYWLLTQFLIFK